MEIILIVLGIAAIFFYFINGLMSNQRDRLDREIEAYEDANKANREADNDLNDSEYRKQLLDADND